MKTIEPGHIYQLHHLDGSGASLLTFVNREIGKHEGTQTQEVLRACIDKAKLDAHQLTEVMTALINRTQHCDACLRWDGNDKIVAALAHVCQAGADVIKHLRAVLVLHESRALERKVEKGELEPETVPTDVDGHFALSTPMQHLGVSGIKEVCAVTTVPSSSEAPAAARRGVFLVMATHGYSVEEDGVDRGHQLSWGDADAMARGIGLRRPPGDVKGYGRKVDPPQPPCPNCERTDCVPHGWQDVCSWPASPEPYRCNVPMCGESGLCAECRKRGAR